MGEIMGGVPSMMTYIGAAHLKEVSKRTTFVRVTAQTNDVFGGAQGRRGEPLGRARNQQFQGFAEDFTGRSHGPALRPEGRARSAGA